ncbi:MAG TPA: pyridoxamine 5'-phosphate oxidase [Gammaproteobacteria bacterium]
MPSLPAPLPDDPLPLMVLWLADAHRDAAQRNPGAMALATSDRDGRPAVRMVLLKSVSAEHGYGVFYTNRKSRKGRDIDANPRAAGALYWEPLGRQLRLEGRVVASPDAESDAYYATRPVGSQVNAWVSRQSAPLSTFVELERRAEHKKRELMSLGGLPRPPFWGGYRLWFDAIEFWVEGPDRFHERARYERTLSGAEREPTAIVAGAWRHELLEP